MRQTLQRKGRLNLYHTKPPSMHWNDELYIMPVNGSLNFNKTQPFFKQPSRRILSNNTIILHHTNPGMSKISHRFFNNSRN